MSDSAAATKHRIPTWVLLTILALYLLDQVSKWWVVFTFELPTPFWLDRVNVLASSFMNFDLVRLHNNGVAFGAGSGTAWAPYVFLSIQVIALIGLIWFFRRGVFSTRLLKFAWALIITGVIGNMTDRLSQGFFLPGAEQLSIWQNLTRGYVVDFLDFSFPWIVTESFPRGYHWPAFNVADSCVCCAAALFIIASFITPGEEKKSNDEQPDAPTTPES